MHIEVFLDLKLLHSRKISRGLIFADGRSSPFRRREHSHPLCTVQSSIFAGLIFAVRRPSTKAAKIGPLKNVPLYSIRSDHNIIAISTKSNLHSAEN